MTRFEWDPAKDAENQQKHGVACADGENTIAAYEISPETGQLQRVLDA